MLVQGQLGERFGGTNDGDSSTHLRFYFQCLTLLQSKSRGPSFGQPCAKSLATTVTLKCAICRPSHSKIGLIMIKRVLPYEGLLHEAVEHNGVLYIGGIVPEDTSLDMSGQANDVLGQLAQLLKTLGSDLTNVLQVTIYMTNLKEKAEFNAAWKAHFAEAHLPARAAIGVADLGPGVRLEITAIAARQ
ncbi:enamine deaminase RidA (YjgF/YER057c/UK114 family) [Bradyrhizobium sp. LB8.2]|uniref:RidA family protein n=1 Tax=unclassified Bradyrhizobium TaxID=2631580 RepID=UPI0033959F3E